MPTVHYDSSSSDEARRWAAYEGDFFLTSPDAATTRFCDFTRELIEEAFADVAPERAQDQHSVERYVEILSVLKPTFIHHPRSKELFRDVLEARGCDLDKTYFDVPRLRTSTSGGYLTTGIAYAWHPHRDTWYSAPLSQLNFWMAVYPIERGNAMAFHPNYFDRVVPNSSSTYNYYEWNAKHRAAASSNVGNGNATSAGPDPGGRHQRSARIRDACRRASSSSRVSICTRACPTTPAGRGSRSISAPSISTTSKPGAPRPTSMSPRWSRSRLIRASDFAPVPDEIVHLFDDGTERRGDVLYVDNRSRRPCGSRPTKTPDSTRSHAPQAVRAEPVSTTPIECVHPGGPVRHRQPVRRGAVDAPPGEPCEGGASHMVISVTGGKCGIAAAPLAWLDGSGPASPGDE